MFGSEGKAFAKTDMGLDMAKQKRIVGDLFLREKPVKIFTGLRSARGSVYATILSKEADCTYSHTIKILNTFKKLGLVRFKKTGRIKQVMLTKNGKDIAQNLDAIVKKLDQVEDGIMAKEKEKKRR